MTIGHLPDHDELCSLASDLSEALDQRHKQISELRVKCELLYPFTTEELKAIRRRFSAPQEEIHYAIPHKIDEVLHVRKQWQDIWPEE